MRRKGSSSMRSSELGIFMSSLWRRDFFNATLKLLFLFLRQHLTGLRQGRAWVM